MPAIGADLNEPNAPEADGNEINGALLGESGLVETEDRIALGFQGGLSPPFIALAFATGVQGLSLIAVQVSGALNCPAKRH